MKKLSLYIFLVLMFCNVGFAEDEIFRFNCRIDKKSLSYPFVGKLSDEQQSNYIGKQLFFTINFTKGYIKNDLGKQKFANATNAQKNSGEWRNDDDLILLHGLGDLGTEKVFNFDTAEFSFKDLLSPGLSYVAQLQISDELIYNYKGVFKFMPPVLRIDVHKNNSTNDALPYLRFEFKCGVGK